MKLQVALDFPAAIGLVPAVAAFVDIVEIGTPLLKRFGLSIVSTMKELAPHSAILADSKTVDGGAAESAMLFDAGADIITVLSCASRSTFDAVDGVARSRGKSALLDTVTEADPGSVASWDLPQSFRYIALHTSTDSRLAGALASSDSFSTARAFETDRELVLAGGISRDNFEDAVGIGPAVIVVGRAITAAADPVETARWMSSRVRMHRSPRS